jgi:hypothetical protein
MCEKQALEELLDEKFTSHVSSKERGKGRWWVNSEPPAMFLSA